LVCNNNYLNIYGLAPHEARPGTHLSDLIRTVQRHGVYPADFATDQLLDDLRERLSGHEDLAAHRHMSDGRRLAVRYRPLSDSSFVCTYEDVTERERAHDELSEQYRRFDAAEPRLFWNDHRLGIVADLATCIAGPSMNPPHAGAFLARKPSAMSAWRV